jgi:hypothetical protein
MDYSAASGYRLFYHLFYVCHLMYVWHHDHRHLDAWELSQDGTDYLLARGAHTA